jgi:hypothetical protein
MKISSLNKYTNIFWFLMRKTSEEIQELIKMKSCEDYWMN